MKTLFFIFLTLLGCSDSTLVKHTIEEKYLYGSYYDVYVQDTATIYVDDTGEDWPIWVDSVVQPGETSGVDILWVIDPSGSMNDDKPRVLAGIQAMMNALPSVNWRLMIIPGDWRYVSSLNEFPLLPGDTYNDALTMYNTNIFGSLESGFDSVYEYIENNQFSSNWMRENAALLIVFVSDEEDQSTVFSSVNNFTNWLGEVRPYSHLSSIVNIPNGACNAYGMNVGNRYIDATNTYNGQVIDICTDDWSAGVLDATAQVSPYEYLELTEVPTDPTSIVMFVDGVVYNFWHYSSSHNRVYFDVIPDENSLIEIAYYYDPNN
jgi:hypothetical protein